MPDLASISRCALPLLGLLVGGAVCAQDDGARFWAFEPPRDVAVPEPSDAAWPQGAVDRFVLRGLERGGLRPAADAGPHALLRRVTFDLTGLPPTPEAVRAFAADPSPARYLEVVDRLLASPGFGERWGRHWLDVVRFAESSGGGRSLMFEHAWRFRDYVVDAFDADRPFDEFVREQIAGDLMESDGDAERNRRLVATGFLELGPINYELQDKELLRMEVIDEQVDTIGRAFMGLTLGCARCHDHKFDPIPATDYYALAGILGSTQVLTPGNVSGQSMRELAGAHVEEWRRYEARREALRQELAQLRGGAKKQGRREPGQLARARLAGIVLDDSEARLVGRWKTSTSVAGYLDRGYLHDEDAGKGEKAVVFTPDVPREGWYEVRVSYTSGRNRASNALVRIEGAGGVRVERIDQRRMPPPGGFVSVGRHRLARGTKNRITIANDGTDGHVIADAVQLLPDGVAAGDRPAARSARVAELEAQLRALEKQAPKKPDVAMAVRDVARPADGHLHIRGLVRKRGAVVPRGFITACGDARPVIPPGQSGRLQLARWLTRPDHPLTARVYVNRVWHHLFGEGLVRTVDNFGQTGARPRDPDLLDWLARRFVAQGWSTKRLVRELVRSRAYRTAAPRRRLDAEAIRDALLLISGELDRTRGGPTIRKLSAYDYGYRFESRRRSLYVPRFRSNRLELFDVFDAADPNLVTGARGASIVAPQALYLLNSPWVMDRARAAATRLLAQESTLDGRLARLYLAVLGRPPEAAEERHARGYLAGRTDDPEAWTGLVHVLFSCLDFRYLD